MCRIPNVLVINRQSEIGVFGCLAWMSPNDVGWLISLVPVLAQQATSWLSLDFPSCRASHRNVKSGFRWHEHTGLSTVLSFLPCLLLFLICLVNVSAALSLPSVQEDLKIELFLNLFVIFFSGTHTPEGCRESTGKQSCVGSPLLAFQGILCVPGHSRGWEPFLGLVSCACRSQLSQTGAWT